MATTLAVYEDERPLWKSLQNPSVVKKFELACGKQAGSVMINIINAANSNPTIWECEPNTVITAALNAATMNLSLVPGTGQACILPFNKNFKDAAGNWQSEKRAQLVVMLRGVKHMAMRTNKYRVLNAFVVWQGQTWVEDQRTGIGYPDGNIAKKTPIGYGAYLKLFNGYEASVYKTVEEITAHAKRYSPTFDKKSGQFDKKSRWVTDFDEQALKTVMKDLIMNHGEINASDRAVLNAIEDPQWPDDTDTVEGETTEAQPEPASIPADDIDSDFPPLPEDEPAPAMTLLEAMDMRASNGAQYGERTDKELSYVLNNAKSPADKREAARLILADRAIKNATPA